MIEKVKDLSGWAGDAVLVKDTDASEFFVVSRAFTGRGDETMIFASDETGEKVDFTDLYAGYGEDHATACGRWLEQKVAA